MSSERETAVHKGCSAAACGGGGGKRESERPRASTHQGLPEADLVAPSSLLQADGTPAWRCYDIVVGVIEVKVDRSVAKWQALDSSAKLTNSFRGDGAAGCRRLIGTLAGGSAQPEPRTRIGHARGTEESLLEV